MLRRAQYASEPALISSDVEHSLFPHRGYGRRNGLSVYWTGDAQTGPKSVRNAPGPSLTLDRKGLTPLSPPRTVGREVFKKRDCCSSSTANCGIRCPFPP
ncbi:hypothetical protein EMIT0158MI4_80011 [Burkholderia ambifaria]